LVLREKMLDVEGREVTIEIIKAGPVTRGKHYHAAHSFSWIIDGSEVQTVPGKAPITVKAGAVIHEEPMQVNESENVGLVMVHRRTHFAYQREDTSRCKST
jgi:hypothetical protein